MSGSGGYVGDRARRRGKPLAGLVLMSALAAAMLWSVVAVGRADAAVVHPFIDSFGPAGVSSAEDFESIGGVGVDEATGAVYVFSSNSNGRLFKFDAAGEPSAFAELGTSVIDDVLPTLGGPGENEVAVAPPSSPGATAGDVYVAKGDGVAVYARGGAKLGELATGEGEVCGVATDPAGHLFVGIYPSTIKEYTPSENPPTSLDLSGTSNAELSGACNVAGDGDGHVFAVRLPFAGSGAVRLESLAAATASSVDPKASTIAVDPASDDLYADEGEAVAQYDAGGTLLGTFGGGRLAQSFGLGVNGQTGEVYVSTGLTGRIAIFGPGIKTADVTVGAATGVTATEATVSGTVAPNGSSLSDCRFEYGPSFSYGFSQPCSGVVPGDEGSHRVSATLTGLASDQTYHFRISATNGSGIAAHSEDATFPTLGPPRISEELPIWVEEGEAILRAQIDPSGFRTAYRFEWGTTRSYGHRAPVDFEPSLAPGSGPVPVTAEIMGLATGTEFHWRVVATNSSATTFGPDRKFETLDSCGLPAQRCYELVSPAEKGPQAAVKVGPLTTNQLSMTASEDGSKVMYPILGGLPNSSSGGEVKYLASRGPSEWTSVQISPEALVTNPSGGVATPGQLLYMSPSLSCSIIESPMPLAPDVPMLDREAGVTNIYLRSSAGNYSLISTLVPADPEFSRNGSYFVIAGASPDCSRVYFSSAYELIRGGSGLYEWDNGVLRDAGELPDGTSATGLLGPGGEVSATSATRLNSVSADGSRFFFSAPSDEGGDGGNRAVFLRDGASTIDTSQSQTATADTGARYELATPDGSHVLFAANYGLAPGASSQGQVGNCATPAQADVGQPSPCDLYDYDVATGELADLSADPNPADVEGASVEGVVAVSRDGSYVYFAARGQLLPDVGKTYAENVQTPGSANVYLSHDGHLAYVATVSAGERTSDSDLASGSAVGTVGGLGNGVLVRSAGTWNAQISLSGSRLLFVSRRNIAGYDSSGVREAYLYDAGSEELQCVTCRRDGAPPIPPVEEESPIPTGSSFVAEALHYPRALSADGQKVIFTSRDRLAPGGSPGSLNLYEWDEGQISLLYALPDSAGPAAQGVAYAEAGADLSDVFFTTPARLVAQDRDNVADLYDARVHGGLAATEGGQGSCDPLTEGSCAPATAVTSATPTAPTETFVGPPNHRVRKPRHRCQKKKACKHAAKHRHRKPRHRGKHRQQKTGRAAK
jgi:hypothetical protein